MIKKFNILLAAAALLSLSSCNREDIVSGTQDDSSPISFGNVSTRAVESAADIEEFSVWATVSSIGSTDVSYQPLLTNERVYRNPAGSSTWTYDNTENWISNSMFYFFAVYPYNIGVQEHRFEYDGEAAIYYALDVTADGSANTEDILIATNITNTNESYSTTVPLQFNHILTKVNLKIRQNFDIDPDFNYYVSKVSITGIKGNGELICDPYNEMFYSEWNLDNATNITLEKVFVEPVLLRNIGAENPVVTLSVWGSDGLMLIPQAITNGGVKVKVEYYYDVNLDDDLYGTAKYVEGFIPAGVWESAMSINYTLSIANQNNISFSQPSIVPWGSPQTGGTIIIQ